MLKLPNVTLACVASTHINESKEAVQKSRDGIIFGDVVALYQENLRSSDEYSYFMLFELGKHIKTDYALIIQWDGYVLRPEKWTDEFFNYDYIGAPWPANEHFTPDGIEIRVGNGGFSFRSKKLLDAFTELGLEFTDGGKGFSHEDGQICNYYRKELEAHGIKFAPVEVAAKFSTEIKVAESVESFGFHRYK